MGTRSSGRAPHDLTQPCIHRGDRVVQVPAELGLHLAQFCLRPLPDRLPHHRESPVPLLPADVREAEESERLRLPLAGTLPGLGREWPEFQPSRLLGVQLQPELCEPLNAYWRAVDCGSCWSRSWRRWPSRPPAASAAMIMLATGATRSAATRPIRAQSSSRRASIPACPFPCQRFASALAGVRA